ncbi:MAG: D-tyrosyl-tRNA(Tyr) deacylase [Prevotellaceae bacterium]|nr:D-tyrosyl-tRNA(Tyr) deacylase [Prevotellaceae bacterium]
MRLLIQRVLSASVAIEGNLKSKISKGLLVLVGFEDADADEDLKRGSQKLTNIRIFDDEEGVMNLSVRDLNGDIMIVSQFTLHAQTKKGNRPSYIKAAKPDIAIPLYEKFINMVEQELGKSVETGEFGADMKVGLVNDGPVTIFIDTREY